MPNHLLTKPRQLSREYKPGEKFDNIDRLPFEDELESYLATRALVLVGRSDHEDLLFAQEELRRRVEEYASLEAAVNAGLIKPGDWSGTTPPFEQEKWASGGFAHPLETIAEMLPLSARDQINCKCVATPLPAGEVLGPGATSTIEGARNDWAPERTEVGFEEQYGEEFERR